MKKEYTDEQLVEMSIDNLDYFTILVERYNEKILRYIKKISTFSEEFAHEILQDTFIKVWKNLNDFDSSLQFSSWIYRIAHNVTISTWKRERKHFGQNLGEEFDIEEISIEDPPSDFIIDQSDKQLISTIMNKLPLKYREILYLHYWDGKTYQELSDIYKKPIGSIGTLLFRAKKKFKIILEEEHNHE